MDLDLQSLPVRTFSIGTSWTMKELGAPNNSHTPCCSHGFVWFHQESMLGQGMDVLSTSVSGAARSILSMKRPL